MVELWVCNNRSLSNLGNSIMFCVMYDGRFAGSECMSNYVSEMKSYSMKFLLKYWVCNNGTRGEFVEKRKMELVPLWAIEDFVD